jgi:hypothetical protein
MSTLVDIKFQGSARVSNPVPLLDHTGGANQRPKPLETVNGNVNFLLQPDFTVPCFYKP